MKIGMQSPYKDKKLLVFLLGLLIAAMFLLPFIIKDGGHLFLWNDFNHQQIPFYITAHEAVRSGSFLWSWTTDLGANFIGSYSFYLLGSPFFWLTVPFPVEWISYLMGPLLMLKFACGGLTGYLFIRRFVRNKYNAVIGGLLYTFSGFCITGMFFNHFQEAVIFSPLLLIALDKLMIEGKKGWFMGAVFINAVVNYFFFVGSLIFTLIYLVIRCKTGGYKMTWSKFWTGIFELVFGCLLSAFLLLPSALVLLGNDRTEEGIGLLNGLFYIKTPGNYLSIISGFFFPPEIQGQMVFFKGSSPWASIGGWLPLFGLTGIVAFWTIKEKRYQFIKWILIISTMIAFVPFLNSMFYLFRSEYYARWFYMPILIMCLATAIALERSRKWHYSIKVILGITGIIALATAFIPSKTLAGWQFGFYDFLKQDRFIVMVIIALVCLLLLWCLFKIKASEKWKKYFYQFTLITLSLVIGLHGIYFIFMGKKYTNSLDAANFIVPNLLEHKIELPDSGTQLERIDSENKHFNLAFYWDKPSINTFHSIISNSVHPLYESIGAKRAMVSNISEKQYAFPSLLSVKWYFNSTAEPNVHLTEKMMLKRNEKIVNKVAPLPGFSFYEKQLDYNIFINDNYIPFGFVYDYYIDEDDYFNELMPQQRDKALLKGLVLKEEQINKYSALLEPLPLETMKDSSCSAFLKDVENRRSITGTEFRRNSSGFDLEIDLPKENLVFVSVPYNSGWSATVNGQPVPIEKVQIGLNGSSM